MFFHRKEGRKNPYLASESNNPTCLSFGYYLVGVLKVYDNCLEGVLGMSGGCLKAVWKVSDGCLKGVLRVSMGYPIGMWGV